MAAPPSIAARIGAQTSWQLQLYIHSLELYKSRTLDSSGHESIYARHNYSPVMAIICTLCLFGVDSAMDEAQSHMVAAVAFAGERSGVCRDL